MGNFDFNALAKPIDTDNQVKLRYQEPKKKKKSQCLKISQKVSLYNIATEASYDFYQSEDNYNLNFGAKN